MSHPSSYLSPHFHHFGVSTDIGTPSEQCDADFDGNHFHHFGGSTDTGTSSERWGTNLGEKCFHHSGVITGGNGHTFTGDSRQNTLGAFFYSAGGNTSPPHESTHPKTTKTTRGEGGRGIPSPVFAKTLTTTTTTVNHHYGVSGGGNHHALPPLWWNGVSVLEVAGCLDP